MGGAFMPAERAVYRLVKTRRDLPHIAIGVRSIRGLFPAFQDPCERPKVVAISFQETSIPAAAESLSACAIDPAASQRAAGQFAERAPLPTALQYMLATGVLE